MSLKQLQRIIVKPTVKDLTEILNYKNKKQKQLFRLASNFKDKKVYLRASLELSNYCRQNCLYCGNNASNKNLSRFRIKGKLLDFLVDEAIAIPEVDFVHFSFGEDLLYPFNELEKQIKKVYDAGKQVNLVLGVLPEKIYKKLFNAANGNPIRYTLKLETTNKKLFSFIKNGYSFEKRLNALKTIKDIGFLPCSGIIVGLPKQTTTMLAQDLLFLKNFNGLVNISASTFTPSPGSVFANERPGNKQTTMNFLALTRILFRNDNITIPASSSLGKQNQLIALKNFSNLISIHLLPKEYQGRYLIYNGANRNIGRLKEIKGLVKKAGLKFNRC